MPRTRLTKQQQLVNTLNALTQLQPQGTVKVATVKRGRPRKAKAVKEIDDASILPVANGYLITSTSTGKEMYVFEDIDKALEFIKAKLKPTTEQVNFLDNV